MEITIKEFKSRYLKPIVYIWKRNNQALYVGKSKHGFYRIVYGKLHSVFRMENTKDDDTVEILFFDTREECLVKEKELIDKLTPPYNFKQGPKLPGQKYKDEILSLKLPRTKSDIKSARYRELKRILG